jgi:hypothetical protein
MGHVGYQNISLGCRFQKYKHAPYSDNMHLKKVIPANRVLKNIFSGGNQIACNNFFSCILSLRHVYIFEICTKRRILLYLAWAFSAKIKFPAYKSPDQLIVQLQMQFSSQRNMSGHYFRALDVKKISFWYSILILASHFHIVKLTVAIQQPQLELTRFFLPSASWRNIFLPTPWECPLLYTVYVLYIFLSRGQNWA